jgi:hypothetical protein
MLATFRLHRYRSASYQKFERLHKETRLARTKKGIRAEVEQQPSGTSIVEISIIDFSPPKRSDLLNTPGVA